MTATPDDDALRDRGEELVGALAARRGPDGDLDWLDELYRAAQDGTVKVPWDRGGPHPQVDQWLATRDGTDRTALVVGCGPGFEAEAAAARGYRVTAFDVSESSVAQARARWPGSSVDYVVADLLAPPTEWRAGFDLVLECQTVQCLPPELHDAALDVLPTLVAPGGSLLVVAGGRPDDVEVAGPPWPLSQAEIERAGRGLVIVSSEQIVIGNPEPGRYFRWRVEWVRPVG